MHPGTIHYLHNNWWCNLWQNWWWFINPFRRDWEILGPPNFDGLEPHVSPFVFGHLADPSLSDTPQKNHLVGGISHYIPTWNPIMIQYWLIHPILHPHFPAQAPIVNPPSCAQCLAEVTLFSTCPRRAICPVAADSLMPPCRQKRQRLAPTNGRSCGG